jgi:hypothetical protein
MQGRTRKNRQEVKAKQKKKGRRGKGRKGEEVEKKMSIPDTILIDLDPPDIYLPHLVKEVLVFFLS